jgi:hypothetical protein
MPRFFDKETEQGTEYWFDNGEQEFQLNENNMLANMHRQPEWDAWDRVAVEDTDQEWFQWWKADFLDTDEHKHQFELMMTVASHIGTVLLRDTPPEQIQSLFENAHQLSDEDTNQINELLGEQDV